MIDDRIGNMVVFDVLRILQVQLMRKINIKIYNKFYIKAFTISTNKVYLNCIVHFNILKAQYNGQGPGSL